MIRSAVARSAVLLPIDATTPITLMTNSSALVKYSYAGKWVGVGSRLVIDG